MNVVNLPLKPDRAPLRGVAARARRRTGFTLIEILVALAIFVVGAIAIVRIFPPAFGVIQGSEYRNIATGLDRSTLAQFSSDPGLIPDATANFNALGAPVTPYTTGTAFSPSVAIAVNGTSSRNASIPNDVTPSAYSQSALNYYGRIIGERHRLQVEQSGVLSTFTRFPYKGDPEVYREDSVNGVLLRADGTLDFTNATLASDASVSFSEGGANPERPPNDMRDNSGLPKCAYYVSYRWVDGPAANRQIQGVIDEPVWMPKDGVTWDANSGVVLQSKRASATVLPGSVSVRFRFQIIGLLAPAIPNYQQIGYVTPKSNGRSSGLPPTLSKALTAGDQVSIDYDVSDWRWMVQESTPDRVPPVTNATPVPNNQQVTLTARPLDDTQTIYSVLSGTFTSGPFQGTVLLKPDTYPSGASNIVGVDYKNGRITYDTSAVDSNATNIHAPHARAVYQTRDGWAHQISVAARSYVPFDSAVNPTWPARQAWREYFWAGPGQSSNIYFRPSEAGKTVLVSFRYADSTGTKHDVSSVLCIDEHLGSPPAGLAGFNEAQVAILPITDQSGNPIPPANMLSISAVQGVGVLARTAWTDQARYQQAAVVNYRPASQL